MFRRLAICFNIFLLLILIFPNFVFSAEASTAELASQTPWWVWPLGLFVFTFVLGIVAVIGGVGGGRALCSDCKRLLSISP